MPAGVAGDSGAQVEKGRTEMIETKTLKTALFAALPFVSLTALAANRQLGAAMKVPGLPSNAIIEDCGNPAYPIYANAYPSDSTGADDMQSTCDSNGNCCDTGADFNTAAATQWSLASSTRCNGLSHHRVVVSNSGFAFNAPGGFYGTDFCHGKDPAGNLDSQCWDTNINANPPQCITSCTAANLPIKYSTNNGQTWSACTTAYSVTGYSFGSN